jgi:MFS family permease
VKVTGLFISLIGIFFSLVMGTIFFSPLTFLLIYPVLGFLMGIIYTEAMAIMVADKDDKKKGFLMGIFESMIGVGFFLGPLIAGFITEYYSYVLSYTTGLLSIFVLIIVSPCIHLIYKYKK